MLRLSSKHNWIGYIYSYIGFAQKQRQAAIAIVNFFICSSVYTYDCVASHLYGCEGIKTAFKHTSMHKRSLERERPCGKNAVFFYSLSPLIALNRMRCTMLLCMLVCTTGIWETRTCFVSKHGSVDNNNSNNNNKPFFSRSYRM